MKKQTIKIWYNWFWPLTSGNCFFKQTSFVQSSSFFPLVGCSIRHSYAVFSIFFAYIKINQSIQIYNLLQLHLFLRNAFSIKCATRYACLFVVSSSTFQDISFFMLWKPWNKTAETFPKLTSIVSTSFDILFYFPLSWLKDTIIGIFSMH